MKISYAATLSKSDLNAIARAFGRSISDGDLMAVYRQEGQAGIDRLIEHGKRGLRLDRAVKRGDIEIGRPHANL